ncbi:hypothetical protein AB0D67_33775 [Streptosporangium sp. NPDC048047]|uniref:hypothetical protein n=1 Tax=Streptosporangium sp. NPDC048047 TaxID=3155748 RepID=UPI0034464AC3
MKVLIPVGRLAADGPLPGAAHARPGTGLRAAAKTPESAPATLTALAALAAPAAPAVETR